MINLKPRRIRVGQTMRLAQGTFNIDRGSAASANDMMVIVADSVLVQSGRLSRLNAPNHSLIDQDPERVVHGLSRDGTDIGSGFLGDFVCRAVGSPRNRPEYGQALGRHLQSVLT